MRRFAIGRAFTIVEMIMVVLIIAILAAILIPGYANASGMASVSAVATDLRAFQSATGRYVADKGWKMPTYNEEYRLGIAPYLEADATLKAPAIGGNYGFHVWNDSGVLGVGVWAPEHPELRLDIDEKIDDGDLDDGAMHAVTSTGLLFIVHGDASGFVWP